MPGVFIGQSFVFASFLDYHRAFLRDYALFAAAFSQRIEPSRISSGRSVTRRSM